MSSTCWYGTLHGRIRLTLSRFLLGQHGKVSVLAKMEERYLHLVAYSSKELVTAVMRSVLADDVRVAALRQDAEFFAQQESEPRRVHQGAGADYPVLRYTEQLPRHVAEDIDWFTRY